MARHEMKTLEISNNEYEIVDEKARPVKSVAEMKAIENLVAGNIIKTIGYYSANDGGGATYLIREKTENDVEDFGSIHFINENLVAELILKNEVLNLKQFGSVGNGANETTVISNAFKYISNKNIILKFDRNGNYVINGNITIFENSRIDLNNSTIKLADNEEINFFRIVGTSDKYNSNVEVINGCFDGNMSTNHNAILSGVVFNLYYAENLKFKNLYFKNNYRNPINGYHCINVEIDNVVYKDFSTIADDQYNTSGGNYCISIEDGKNISLHNMTILNTMGSGGVHFRSVENIEMNNIIGENIELKGTNHGTLITFTKCKRIIASNIKCAKCNKHAFEINEGCENVDIKNIIIEETTFPITISANGNIEELNDNITLENIIIKDTVNQYAIAINYSHNIHIKNCDVIGSIGADNEISNIFIENSKIVDTNNNGGTLFSKSGVFVTNTYINDHLYKTVKTPETSNIIITGSMPAQGTINIPLNFKVNFVGKLIIKSYNPTSPNQYYFAEYMFVMSKLNNDGGTLSEVLHSSGSNYRKITPTVSNKILTLSTTSDVDLNYIVEMV